MAKKERNHSQEAIQSDQLSRTFKVKNDNNIRRYEDRQKKQERRHRE